MRSIVGSPVDTQVRELRQKAAAEQEKKSSKFSQLSERFGKLSERFAQMEAAKKSYADKWKDAERSAKDMATELAALRERVDALGKENAELRKERVSKEKYLIDKLKRTERELARASAVGGQGQGLAATQAAPTVGDAGYRDRDSLKETPTLPAKSQVAWDQEARDIIDQEWEQFRTQERKRVNQ